MKKFIERSKKYNTYDLSGEYGIGYTEEDKMFYFDLEDYDKIKDYYWNIDNQGYVVTKFHDTAIEMHRLIMNCPPNKIVDHMKHINYDNRKNELRICNKSKNGMNMKLPKDNKSGCKGVCWDKTHNLWVARITVNKNVIRLGYFNNLNKAIKVRKEAEQKYFGEFSYDNSMKGEQNY